MVNSTAAARKPAKVKKTITTTISMDEYTKAVVDTAAKYAYQTRTDFILSAAREKAEKIAKERSETLRQVAPIVLSKRDSKVFLETLERDFKPTEALLDLSERYRSLDIADRT